MTYNYDLVLILKKGVRSGGKLNPGFHNHFKSESLLLTVHWPFYYIARVAISNTFFGCKEA